MSHSALNSTLPIPAFLLCPFLGPILCSRSTVSQQCGVERNISVGIHLLIYTTNKSVCGDNKSLLTVQRKFSLLRLRLSVKLERSGRGGGGGEEGEWHRWWRKRGMGHSTGGEGKRWKTERFAVGQHNDNDSKRANNSRDNIFPRRSMSLMRWMWCLHL